MRWEMLLTRLLALWLATSMVAGNEKLSGSWTIDTPVDSAYNYLVHGEHTGTRSEQHTTPMAITHPSVYRAGWDWACNDRGALTSGV
jgi:hypothetical protein